MKFAKLITYLYLILIISNCIVESINIAKSARSKNIKAHTKTITKRGSMGIIEHIQKITPAQYFIFLHWSNPRIRS